MCIEYDEAKRECNSRTAYTFDGKEKEGCFRCVVWDLITNRPLIIQPTEKIYRDANMARNMSFDIEGYNCWIMQVFRNGRWENLSSSEESKEEDHMRMQREERKK